MLQIINLNQNLKILITEEKIKKMIIVEKEIKEKETINKLKRSDYLI